MISAALADEHQSEMLEAARAAYPIRSNRHHQRRRRTRSLAAKLRSR